MSTTTILSAVKTLLGIAASDTTKDAVLGLLIGQAEIEAKTYCHLSDLPRDLKPVVCQMAIVKYGRMGTEGLNSESYSGVSFNYSDEYPAPIMRQLKAHRKAVII